MTQQKMNKQQKLYVSLSQN